MEDIASHYDRMDESELNHSLERMMDKFEKLSRGYHASRRAPKTSDLPLINRLEHGIGSELREKYSERLDQVEYNIDIALEVAEEKSFSLDKDYRERSNELWIESKDFVTDISLDRVALVELAKSNLE